MNWYTVEENYLNYLKEKESKIPNINYENAIKPFFGKLFEIEINNKKIIYLTQVSHPKKRHYKMKNNIDFIKLIKEDTKQLIAVVNLNYMFPVEEKYILKIEYKNINSFRNFKNEDEKNKYISLLKTELKLIEKNSIDKKAKKLYELKDLKPNHIVSKRCLNFKELEKHILSFTIK